jgi:hypothetical protein
MSDDSLTHLPGAEIVLPGIADLKAGRHTVNASAVQSAAPRLRRAGLVCRARKATTPQRTFCTGS